MRLGTLGLAVLLSACAAAPEVSAPPAFVPDAEGIAIVGAPLRIDFGRTEDSTISAVTRLEGSGPREVVDCGGVRAARWRSGLALHFRDGAFLGWARPDGSGAGIPCA